MSRQRVERIRYGRKYMVWEVIPLLEAQTITLDGETMNVSTRMKTYLKGVVCVRCGLKGKYFMKTKYSNQPRPHLNLYAIDERGREVLMTSDHILPKSKGGGSSLGNRQPMCAECNTEKGNQIEG